MYKVDKSVISWLLENNNPPVKYLTLAKLLDENKDSIKAQEAFQDIMTYRPIVEIFAEQKDSRYWFDKKKTHNYKKYLGTFWQLLFLYEMQAEKNEQITNAIEHIFETGQAANGGFSVNGTNSYAVECLTANMLRVLINYGYYDDERTQKALEFLLMRFVDTNGKVRCQTVGLLDSCYMVLPKVLYALSMIPKKDHTNPITKGINLCVERMLDNHIFKYLPEKNREFLKEVNEGKLKGKYRKDKRDSYLKDFPNMKKIPKKGWMVFSFPNSYTSDVLDAMRSLKLANVNYSPNMADAIELIKTKAIDGVWINENKFKSPMHTTIEDYQQKSKWLTFHALSILKFYDGLVIIDD